MLWIIWIVFILTIAFAIFGSIKIPKEYFLKKYFITFLIISSAWLMANILLLYYVNILFVKTAYATGSLVLAGMTALAASFSKQGKLTRSSLVLIYGLSFFFVALSFVPNLFFVDTSLTPSLAVIYTKWFTAYFLYFFIALVFVSLIFFSCMKKFKGIKKVQAEYMSVGTLIFGFLAFVSSFVLPLFQCTQFAMLDTCCLLFFIVATFYAILKHRLMDIHIIIRWSTVVSVLAVVLTSLYVTGVVFATKYFNMDMMGIRLLVTVFIVGTLLLFHRTIKRIIESIVLMREKDEKEELDELYQNLATSLDLKELKWIVISELESIFRTRCVTLVLFDLKDRRFKVYASVGYEEIEKVYVAKKSPLVTWLMNNNRPAVYDWLDAEREEDKKVQDTMDDMNMEVAMVLAHNDTMVGFLGMSEKKRRRYTADEIVLFAEFCEKMAVPFTNAVKHRLDVGKDDEEDDQNEKLPSISVPPSLNEPGKPKIYFRGVEVKDDPNDPYSVCIGPLRAVNRKWDWIKMRDRYDPSTKEIRLCEDEKKDETENDDGDDSA